MICGLVLRFGVSDDQIRSASNRYGSAAAIVIRKSVRRIPASGLKSKCRILEAECSLTPSKPLSFDLDGTLRHSIPSADDTQFRIASQLGAVDDPELQKLGARWAHYYWAQSTELAEDMERFGDHNEGILASLWVPLPAVS